MDLRDALLEGFEYDLWANRQWLRDLGGFDERMGEAQSILEHILSAQSVWLERSGVGVVQSGENVALGELFELHSRAWQAQVADRPLDERISYKTRSGDAYMNTMGQIARHVLNHGTYHRGQLRGLAQACAFEGFSETDFIRFLWEHGR